MHTAIPVRRRLLFLATSATAILAAGFVNALPAVAQPAPAGPWPALREDGAIVLFRHAEAPGIGDPTGFRLGDCATQRNLSEAGREQARRSGEELRRQRIPVGAVWSSQWCRTRDTAALMALGPVRDEPAFNSFFGEHGDRAARTAAARRKLLDWRGPGALVVVTHQVNITALTGLGVASAEGIVLQRRGGALAVTGRIAPPR
ncbi:histidine phosphatase family protein [uncultured Azohydromonas sp.]|jgi:Phosphohistidine phosphatase SixA|uniref:histidine phosphatase family protein n=1 Tax=uncultured Azohydromonas sp. TaxID=487342 RepID=UPI00261B606A|nr:histidine phosphatase family protein [uncultured Azohydromonas sp.]